jgi:hypothetical protein
MSVAAVCHSSSLLGTDGKGSVRPPNPMLVVVRKRRDVGNCALAVRPDSVVHSSPPLNSGGQSLRHAKTLVTLNLWDGARDP